jgi:parallel beta-helix repeat protein
MQFGYFLSQPGQAIGVGLAATLWLTVGGGGAIAQSVSQVTGSTQTLAQVPSQTASYLIFVNPTLGNDSNNGHQGTPLRTISRALQFLQASHQTNAVILLAPGTYSTDTGETFPLLLQPGITIQGDPASQGEGIVIRGGGAFLSPTTAQQNIAVLAANGSVITGVTVTNPNPRGYGVWIESSSPTVVSNTFSGSTHDGVSIVGNSAPLVQGNAFVQNGANGISIYGTAQPQVRDNRFERTGYGINVSQSAAPVITNNRILNNRSGVVVQDRAQPILQGNTIEGNREDGVVAIARSLPNLGTASAPGNNQFQNNGRYDINASSVQQPIPAVGNQLVSQRTAGRVELSGTVANTPVVNTPVASAPVAPSSIATATASTVTRSSTPAVTRPAIATPPTSPATSRSTTANGFASLPRLQSSQPSIPQTLTSNSSATTRPNPPEQLPLRATSTPAVPASFPTSTARRSPSTSTISASSFPTPAPTSANRTLAASPRLNDAPIDIPVQLPLTGESRTSSSSRPSESLPQLTVRRSPQPASTSPSATSQNPASTSIPIPVIAPTIRPSAPPPSVNSAIAAAPRAIAPTPQAPVIQRTVPSANVLPVPGGNIPVGNIGDMPTVTVSRNPLQRGASVLSSSNSTVAMGLRYRVVVEAEDEGTQEWVRAIVPGAFRTYTNGRVMMQAGAYSDRNNADEAARQLTNSGLRAMVQPLQ